MGHAVRRAARTLALLVVVGCGPTAAERARCYQAADAVAQARVDRECPGSFATCPAAEAIVDELRDAQEACP